MKIVEGEVEEETVVAGPIKTRTLGMGMLPLFLTGKLSNTFDTASANYLMEG